MDLGVTVFATDRTADPVTIAREAEDRGFASLYLPEHTHMPVELDGPLPAGTDELDEGYRRTLDPFVALAAAASATRSIRLGTGISLVAQHDPIALAKQVATLDHLSGGRFVLGVGYGWNRAEMSNHGIDPARRRQVVREHVLAMQALWSQEVASFRGDFVAFEPSWSWPKPAPGPRVRTLLGAAPTPATFADIAAWADGWIPFGGSGVRSARAELRRHFEAAGRDPDSAWIVPFGTEPTAGKLEHYRSIGVQEVVLRLPAADRDTTCRALDELSGFL